jgi:hypothetical protein
LPKNSRKRRRDKGMVSFDFVFGVVILYLH